MPRVDKRLESIFPQTNAGFAAAKKGDFKGAKKHVAKAGRDARDLERDKAQALEADFVSLGANLDSIGAEAGLDRFASSSALSAGVNQKDVDALMAQQTDYARLRRDDEAAKLERQLSVLPAATKKRSPASSPQGGNNSSRPSGAVKPPTRPPRPVVLSEEEELEAELLAETLAELPLAGLPVGERTKRSSPSPQLNNPPRSSGEGKPAPAKPASTNESPAPAAPTPKQPPAAGPSHSADRAPTPNAPRSAKIAALQNALTGLVERKERLSTKVKSDKESLTLMKKNDGGRQRLLKKLKLRAKTIKSITGQIKNLTAQINGLGGVAQTTPQSKQPGNAAVFPQVAAAAAAPAVAPPQPAPAAESVAPVAARPAPVVQARPAPVTPVASVYPKLDTTTQPPAPAPSNAYPVMGASEPDYAPSAPDLDVDPLAVSQQPALLYREPPAKNPVPPVEAVQRAPAWQTSTATVLSNLTGNSPTKDYFQKFSDKFGNKDKKEIIKEAETQAQQKSAAQPQTDKEKQESEDYLLALKMQLDEMDGTSNSGPSRR
jgi:hypothetical protein